MYPFVDDGAEHKGESLDAVGRMMIPVVVRFGHDADSFSPIAKPHPIVSDGVLGV